MLRRAVTFAERAGRLPKVAVAGELGLRSGVPSDIGSGVEGEDVVAACWPAPNGK